MKTKTVVIAIAVIVLAGLGYFAYTYKAKAPEPEPVTNSAQGKINIDEVCRGALAYMTFSDGASADAFVADCKEGKHPEVIERYKADMNLGAGAQI
ncbi:MAG: hypothetical protein AAB883_00375 [Patescibacteria group bacterium]